MINVNKRLCFVLLLAVAFMNPSYAKIFYSKQEAMVLAFGEQATVKMLPLFLSKEERKRIQQLARVKLDSSLFTFYVGKKAGKIIGYAAIESRQVRTQPETLLIVLNAQGQLIQVETLAFHEPSEYQLSTRWFTQLFNLPLAELTTGTGIQGVSGATLSTRAAIDSVRKVLAIYQILLTEK